MRANANDMRGRRFGHLVVIRACGRKCAQIKWLCQCDCGNTTEVIGGNLRGGSTKSCGCLRKKASSDRIKKRYSENIENWSDWNKGKVSPKKGMKCPETSGYRNGMHGVHRFGKDNPNYNPKLTKQDRQDRRTIFEYTEWRRLVYERDGFICRMCDNPSKGIAAHHIAPWATFKFLRFSLLNGITLCKKCHDSIHHKELSYAKLFFAYTGLSGYRSTIYPKQSFCL